MITPTLPPAANAMGVPRRWLGPKLLTLQWHILLEANSRSDRRCSASHYEQPGRAHVELQNKNDYVMQFVNTIAPTHNTSRKITP